MLISKSIHNSYLHVKKTSYLLIHGNNLDGSLNTNLSQITPLITLPFYLCFLSFSSFPWLFFSPFSQIFPSFLLTLSLFLVKLTSKITINTCISFYTSYYTQITLIRSYLSLSLSTRKKKLERKAWRLTAETKKMSSHVPFSLLIPFIYKVNCIGVIFSLAILHLPTLPLVHVAYSTKYLTRLQHFTCFKMQNRHMQCPWLSNGSGVASLITKQYCRQWAATAVAPNSTRALHPTL